ncbi:hypothetical protein JWJ90_17050 [Desulfobulbus rhabdoformis]|uniref:hypothetical protein n=1 Tax=Desulfobulbus rhabdoformis TaxID=34032 RepID=UPI001962837B|nr:hypothetical protein [Desulfobulbus rhabdoformis]MBM9615979.1 hypothetical protein [Desulfobulbus rhabdoformis]
MQDNTTTIFKGKTVTVQELTVKQVRELFERMQRGEPLFIEDLLDQPVPILAVSESTGIPLDELEDTKPSELIPLCQEVTTLNPSLASMIRRRIEAADRLQEVIAHSAKN